MERPLGAPPTRRWPRSQAAQVAAADASHLPHADGHGATAIGAARQKSKGAERTAKRLPCRKERRAAMRAMRARRPARLVETRGGGA